MMKKLLCMLLASLMVVGTLASCGTGTETEDTTAPGSIADTNVESETRETLDVPDTRYDGKELCFLTRDEGEWSTLEIFAEDQTSESDNISTAVFERNDRILQTYGVTITELKKPTGEHYTALVPGDMRQVQSFRGAGDFHPSRLPPVLPDGKRHQEWA